MYTYKPALSLTCTVVFFTFFPWDTLNIFFSNNTQKSVDVFFVLSLIQHLVVHILVEKQVFGLGWSCLIFRQISRELVLSPNDHSAGMLWFNDHDCEALNQNKTKLQSN